MDDDIESPLWLAGTGSRSFKPNHGTDVQMERVIDRLRLRYPHLELLSGMAEGFDEYVARVAMRLGIPFHAAIPNKGYGEYYWGRNSLSGRDRMSEFAALLRAAKTITYVCDSLYVDGVHSNFLRNQWMVDRAQHFVVFNPTSRGTADCVRRISLAKVPYTEIRA